VEATFRVQNPGSSTLNPDLDWSQIRETLVMLCLATAQIECSLNDSAKSMDLLTTSFTGMAEDTSSILKIAKELAVMDHHLDEKDKLQGIAEKMNLEVHQSVMSFQFYDRLTQKLSHVTNCLANLADLIADPQCLYNPNEWKLIQDDIRKSYTMDCERLMFEHIMRGSTLQEALQLYNHNFDDKEGGATINNDDEDDIELF